MLKKLGLVIFYQLYKANQEMYKDYRKEKDDLIDEVLKGTILINTPQLSAEIEKRFGAILNKYFINGMDASKLLVDKEVAVLVDALKVPWKYNRDVIDLVNNNSVFKGFADQLYKEGFKRGEIDRIKRVLLKGTYNNLDEKVLRDELQKSFNLTKRRAQLLARDESSRLRETTKKVYYQQPEVQEKYELVWDAVGDKKTRPAHQELDGKVANSDGNFYSPTFGEVGPPPLDYNCRCSTFFKRK